MDIGTRIHTTDSGDVTFERVQDCTPILEHTTKLSNEGFHGSSEMRHAASFPMVVVERYLNDNNITLAEFSSNKEHVKRMLNDPSLAWFRIWKGRV